VPDDEELRGEASAQLEEGVEPVALVLDVEAGAEPLDQRQLPEQRRELARLVVPFQRARVT
jgi:hypothetical protein